MNWRGEHPDYEYLAKWGAQSEIKLDQLSQRRKLLRPAFVLGLVATALVWLLAIVFPYHATLLYSGVFNTNVPHFGDLLTIAAMAIPFAPPFVSVFALGYMLFPARDESEDPNGIMSGFNYWQNANRRWRIVMAAGVCGALNCFLLMWALLVVTGN